MVAAVDFDVLGLHTMPGLSPNARGHERWIHASIKRRPLHEDRDPPPGLSDRPKYRSFFPLLEPRIPCCVLTGLNQDPACSQEMKQKKFVEILRWTV